MKPVRLLPEAEEELWQAVDFYEKKIQGLGLDLEKAISKAFFAIQEFPQIYQKTSSGERRYLLQRFPFNIIYDELPDVIQITAIAHTRRKPRYWRTRII